MRTLVRDADPTALRSELLIVAAAIEWAPRLDGCIHILQDGHDVPRGPLGLLLYLAFIPLYWMVPARHRATFLSLSSLICLLLTLGPAYTATVLLLTLLGLAMVREFARPRHWGKGIALLSVVYAFWLWQPQPGWLPLVTAPPLSKEPLYFYLHWAGIGYVFLKTVHVLVDVGQAKLLAPSAKDFLAYLLFAPTIRMGPIYRFGEFSDQLQRDPRRHVDFSGAGVRFVTGFLRLGVMAALLGRHPIDAVFTSPDTLSNGDFLLRLYLAPLSIYLWISGYVDLSVALGKLMGFTVPDNFNYPWISRSLAEFWRRWHITLGAWLRDYLYIPLGGNRRHVSFNYFVAFLFCGVWHGLYLSYVLWGISQGVGLAVGRAWRLYWQRHRETGTSLYRGLRRLRLVDSPLNAAVGWLLTFNYQILTIALFMDEANAGRLMFRQLLSGT